MSVAGRDFHIRRSKMLASNTLGCSHSSCLYLNWMSSTRESGMFIKTPFPLISDVVHEDRGKKGTTVELRLLFVSIITARRSATCAASDRAWFLIPPHKGNKLTTFFVRTSKSCVGIERLGSRNDMKSIIGRGGPIFILSSHHVYRTHALEIDTRGWHNIL